MLVCNTKKATLWRLFRCLHRVRLSNSQKFACCSLQLCPSRYLLGCWRFFSVCAPNLFAVLIVHRQQDYSPLLGALVLVHYHAWALYLSALFRGSCRVCPFLVFPSLQCALAAFYPICGYFICCGLQGVSVVALYISQRCFFPHSLHSLFLAVFRGFLCFGDNFYHLHIFRGLIQLFSVGVAH